jgi:hypothetical protein
MAATHIAIKNNLVICGALLFFLSCCSKPSHWSSSHVKTGSSAFDSSELCFRTTDPVNGLDLAMIRTKESLRLYLEVRSRAIPPYQNNPKQALVEVLIGSDKYSFIGFRHEGGQRLLLPNDCQEIVLDSLKNNITVTFHLSGYKAVIDPKDFEAKFKKLGSPPLSNPFHLPF